MKEQIRIIIGNKDTGEIYEHPDMGVVEKLDMRRRQHREGWVTEASFPSCYASAVRWITENVIAHGDTSWGPVHEWSVKITIGLNSLVIGSDSFDEPTKIVDATTVSGDSVRYIVKGTDNLAKRYDAWDFEHDSDPQLYAFDLDVRYVFDMDEGLDVETMKTHDHYDLGPDSGPFLDGDFDIASIDSVTFPYPIDWTERVHYRNYRK
tara:strand:+ start:694 stop:1314 length:621 start_codon:yes stop_codon:yes gene_type:complete